MRINTKLTLNSLLVLVLLVVNIVVAIFLINQMMEYTRQLVEIEEPLEQAVLEMEINAGEAARALLNYVRGQKEHNIDKMNDSDLDFEHWAKEFERLVENEKERTLGRKVTGLYREFKALAGEIVSISKRRSEELQMFQQDYLEIDELIDEELQLAIDHSTVDALTKLEAALDMEINIDEAFATIEGYVLQLNSEAKRNVADSEADFKRFKAQYHTTSLSSSEKDVLARIDKQFTGMMTAGNRIIALTDELNKKLGKFEAILEDIDRILDDEIQPVIHAQTKRAGMSARHTGSLAMVFEIAIGLFIFAVVVGVGLLVSKGIINAAKQLTKGAEQFARGNFDHRIEVLTRDELSVLAAAFNEMADNIQRLAEDNRRYQENLEQLVEERTAALVESEEQYHQAQKAESIGRLAGGVAHDFNNLLVPVLGCAEMLLEDLDPEDERRGSVDEILRAGTRARNLVRQLLAFSRKQTLEYKLVNLNEAIQNFEKLLRRTIRENIQIDFVPSIGIQPVLADIGQIEQVIMNLSVNAQDSMTDGGHLTIETGLINLDEDSTNMHLSVKPGTYVMVAVSDTGTGMDDETREHLFEPFFSTKGDQGTGLGMATVYGIVKQHGGNMGVYSKLGEGTTIKFYLPVSNRKQSELKTGKITTTSLGGSETILLVEDDEQVLNLVHAILERQGYTVLVAGSGKEALMILNRNDGPLHLLMTDVIMPGMNGKELFDKAIESHPGLKVLFMSGYTDDVIAHHGMMDEGVQFIQKPFSIRPLAAKVREVLDAK